MLTEALLRDMASQPDNCPGIGLGDGNWSGCACDCPSCSGARSHARLLAREVLALRKKMWKYEVETLEIAGEQEASILALRESLRWALKRVQPFENLCPGCRRTKPTAAVLFNHEAACDLVAAQKLLSEEARNGN